MRTRRTKKSAPPRWWSALHWLGFHQPLKPCHAGVSRCAGPTGFEPAISALTGRRVRPGYTTGPFLREIYHVSRENVKKTQERSILPCVAPKLSFLKHRTYAVSLWRKGFGAGVGRPGPPTPALKTPEKGNYSAGPHSVRSSREAAEGPQKPPGGNRLDPYRHCGRTAE